MCVETIDSCKRIALLGGVRMGVMGRGPGWVISGKVVEEVVCATKGEGTFSLFRGGGDVLRGELMNRVWMEGERDGGKWGRVWLAGMEEMGGSWVEVWARWEEMKVLVRLLDIGKRWLMLMLMLVFRTWVWMIDLTRSRLLKMMMRMREMRRRLMDIGC